MEEKTGLIEYDNDKYKCPKCGSTQVWINVSVEAKMNPNTRKIFDKTNVIDNEFWGGVFGCKKCGYEGNNYE